MKKPLPTKTCIVCKRPFAWRKKWEKDWENVIEIFKNEIQLSLGSEFPDDA